jgi:VCBS repeat-containing protein
MPLRLESLVDGVIQEFTYDDREDDWPESADGLGSTLEIIDPFDDYDDPDNWRAEPLGGSPGVGIDAQLDEIALSAEVVTLPSGGTLTLDRDGSFIYSPRANFHGLDRFTYRVTDLSGRAEEATVTITVRSVNDPPQARADHYSVAQDGLLIVGATDGVLLNDSDVDGDLLRAELATPPTHGELSLNSDGSFTYTPDVGFVGEDRFDYQASDGSTSTESQTVTINVIVSRSTAQASR